MDHKRSYEKWATFLTEMGRATFRESEKRVMADDISLQKRLSPKRERYDKWWKEGYKAGTINTPLPDHYTPRYLAGYEEGLIELNRLMNLDDHSDKYVRNQPSWSPLPDINLQQRRPPEFDKWGAYAVGRDCKARCILRREDMISLLQYVLLLERRVAQLELELEKDGSFW